MSSSGKPSAAWDPVDDKSSAAFSGAFSTSPGIASRSFGTTVSPLCESGDNDVDGDDTHTISKCVRV